MPLIYHIIPRSTWEARLPGPYRAGSLDREGFIHCSYQRQVARVANCFYRDQPDLVALCIDTTRLRSPLRDEDSGAGERFPHVYGPIDEPAIVAVVPLVRAASGEWHFPAQEALPGVEK
jgi:uncharacterized protein (DUF952 family)